MAKCLIKKVIMKEKSNLTKLQEVVMSHSENTKNWNETKQEWYVHSCFVKDDENCSCGHDIKNVFIIKNKKNKNTLQIGSTCIQHFDDKEMYSTSKNLLKRLKSLENRNRKAFIDAENERYEMHLNRIVQKCLIQKYINEWEYDFYQRVTGFKKLSEKQEIVCKRIKTKLNRFFVTNPADFDVQHVKQIIADRKTNNYAEHNR